MIESDGTRFKINRPAIVGMTAVQQQILQGNIQRIIIGCEHSVITGAFIVYPIH